MDRPAFPSARPLVWSNCRPCTSEVDAVRDPGRRPMAGAIEDLGLIGDMQTAALVGRDGSIDWLSLPRFDSAACFAALLGGPENGRWLVAATEPGAAASRAYRPDTLVLETEWSTAEGRVRVTDFMPPRGKAPDVVRIVEGLPGRGGGGLAPGV